MIGAGLFRVIFGFAERVFDVRRVTGAARTIGARRRVFDPLLILAVMGGAAKRTAGRSSAIVD